MNHAWVLCVASLLATGCSADRAPTVGTGPRPAEGTGPSVPTNAAETAVAAFSLTPNEINRSFVTVDRLAISDPGELRAAGLAHIDATDEGVRYAAVYALALTATSASQTALRDVMVSDAPWERLLAATALAGLGDRDAVPVIIGFLGDDASFPHWEPPTTYWRFARRQLLSLTDRDFALSAATDSASAAATIPAWTQWWAANGATFQPRAREVRLP